MKTIRLFALFTLLYSTAAYPSSNTIYIAPPEHIAQLDLAKLWFEANQCVQRAELEERNGQLTGNLVVRLKEGAQCYAKKFLEAQDPEASEGQFARWRDTWIENYLPAIAQLKTNFVIPKTHAQFLKLTGYEKWESETIDSLIKRRPRTIWRHFDFKGHKVRITRMKLTQEECDDHSGEPSGAASACVEHEVAISLADNYVFAVYDHRGNLTDRAQFSGHQKKMPISCNGCHYSQQTRSLSRFFKN